MEIGVLIVVAVGVFLGFLVLQGTFAARAWRERIAGGDLDVLGQAVDAAFESWREMRPPKGMPAADWAALASAELVAADRDRARASLIADADVRVVAGGRREVAGPLAVGRRVALLMAERLLYEIPHVRFAEVQIDVWERYRDASGSTRTRPLLTTRASREQAAGVDWSTRWELDPPAAAGEAGGAAAVLAAWATRERAGAVDVDPDAGALIAPGEGIAPGGGPAGRGAEPGAAGAPPAVRAGAAGGGAPR